MWKFASEGVNGLHLLWQKRPLNLVNKEQEYLTQLPGVQMANSHHDLKAWQWSMDLVEEVYQVTTNFPDCEKYGLVAQLRRASVSLPSNIAEGAARQSTKEFLRFLYIARGSLAEVQTQLFLAKRLGFANDVEIVLNQVDQVFLLLGGLIRELKKQTQRQA